MSRIMITTPPGASFSTATAAGGAAGRLTWAPDFGKRYTASFMAAQRFVDSEVLRFCTARVPFRTGMLQKSGIFGTVIGGGVVSYVAPYAARQYKSAPTRGYDANRGGMWFERGKAAEGAHILEAASRIAGGK